MLNKSRLAQQLRVRYPPPVDIDAVDPRGFLFNMTVLPLGNGASQMPSNVVSVAVALYSRPPTRHDRKLEMKVLTMTTEGLECSVHQLEHNDNGTAADEMYRTISQQYRGWIDQAKAAAPHSDALHLH